MCCVVSCVVCCFLLQKNISELNCRPTKSINEFLVELISIGIYWDFYFNRKWFVIIVSFYMWVRSWVWLYILICGFLLFSYSIALFIRRHIVIIVVNIVSVCIVCVNSLFFYFFIIFNTNKELMIVHPNVLLLNFIIT